MVGNMSLSLPDDIAAEKAVSLCNKYVFLTILAGVYYQKDSIVILFHRNPYFIRSNSQNNSPMVLMIYHPCIIIPTELIFP